MAGRLVRCVLDVESMTLVSSCGTSPDVPFSTEWLGRSGVWVADDKMTLLMSWFIGISIDETSLDAIEKYPMLAE